MFDGVKPHAVSKETAPYSQFRRQQMCLLLNRFPRCPKQIQLVLREKLCGSKRWFIKASKWGLWVCFKKCQCVKNSSMGIIWPFKPSKITISTVKHIVLFEVYPTMLLNGFISLNSLVLYELLIYHFYFSISILFFLFFLIHFNHDHATTLSLYVYIYVQ